MSKVAVIVLNFKVKEQALNCLNSVLNSSYQDLIVYLVDNNSQDGIEEQLPKDSRVNFIQTGDNLGYSGGNNVGIKAAIKAEAEFIFVLNPDTLIEKQTIENLVKSADDLSLGIIGPKILFADKKTIWYAGGIFDEANVIGSHRGVDEKDSGQYDQPQETDFVSGAAMFFNAKVLNKIGLFDEKYFLYYEDADLSKRVKLAGFKCWYQPKALVYHKNAQSTGLGSPIQDYYITRNRMLYAFKFLSWRTRFAILREGIKNWSSPTRRQALIDFLLGRFGKAKI